MSPDTPDISMAITSFKQPSIPEERNKYISVLKEGVKTWNEWREKNPQIMPDLRGINFSGADFRNSLLTGADLRYSDFRKANLNKANLNEGMFEDADLRYTSIRNVVFSARQLISHAFFSDEYLSDIDFFYNRFSEEDFGEPFFIEADLMGINLSDADLSGSNFRKANFSHADFTGADFKRASFQGATLNSVTLDGAYFHDALMIGVDLSKSNVCEWDMRWADIRGINLSGVNLRGKVLTEATLIGANFNRADFREANLSRTLALNTNFKNAIFTGACIEDWRINSGTTLDGVICDYVYLKQGQQERCPSEGNFAPGEFTRLFQEIDNTIDLIFRNGINWKAFALAFNQVNAQILDTNEEGEIFLREYKVLGDGIIALKVTTPPGINKVKLRDELINCYKKIASLEGELKAKNKELKDKGYWLERLYDRLLLPSTQIIKSTLNIQNIQNAEGDTNLVSEPNKQYTFQAPVGSVENQGHIASSGNQNNIGNAAGEAQAELKSIQHIHNYAPEQKQTLAEAAAEIQNLLKQLEQTNPSATEAEQIEHINDETTPKFKKRVVGALQATGEAAIDEFVLENKYLKVAKAAIKGWIKPE
jgi:uncharacterized protein YjbI with pentapeptide repeats